MSITKQTLILTYGVSIALANVLAAKIAWITLPVIGGVGIPAGFIGIAVAFLCSDLIVERYGTDVAHRMVIGTLIALCIGLVLIQVAVWMPVAPFYAHQQSFVLLLQSGTAITLASICTLCVSQNVDVLLFEGIHERTGDSHRWVRNIGSTSLSQLVDTVLFVVLGFIVLPPLVGGISYSLSVAVGLIIGQYIVKVGVALLDTPFFYVVTTGWSLIDSNRDQAQQ